MSELVREGSIGAVLFTSGIITEEELRAALKEQQVSGCRIGEALVSLGLVAQEDIDWALSHQLDLPWVRLKREDLDPAALARVPADLARRHRVVPVILAGDELSVAMEDPLDEEARAALERETGCRINVSVGLRREIGEILDLCYGTSDLGFRSRHLDVAVVDAINADPSAAKLLDQLLLLMLQHGVAQLSLAPVGERVVVLEREGGRALEIGELPARSYPVLLARVRRLAHLAATPVAASGILSLQWQGREIQFQALLLREELLTLKRQAVSAQLTSLAELRLAPEKERELRLLCAVPEGLLVFGGRDERARAACLDLLVDHVDREGKTVLLLGEGLRKGPFPGLAAKRQGVDETRVLIEAALEHEPDLLVVEELADQAAIIGASRAALRGTAVVAGIGGSGMVSVLERLFELRRERYLVPSLLKGALFVTAPLLLCPKCKEVYRPNQDELAVLRLSSSQERLFRRGACPACAQSGHQGRRYLVELVLFQGETAALFRDAHSATDLLARLKEKGYRGVAEQGRDLLENGEISAAEYLASVAGG